jgi:uncharacterized delta-60 repeat protein
MAIYFSASSYLGEYSVDRIYYTGSSVNPQYWGNWFGGGPAGNPGDSIPSYLLKPGFAWDGDRNEINNAVNEGRFLLTHRDHGATWGWGDPYYRTNNAQGLINGSKLPVVWSINCQTGWFDNETDDSSTGTSSNAIHFSEAWERNVNGGAVGIIAATRVSYSGHNDRLVWGWMDAIWPEFDSSYNLSSTPFENPVWDMGPVVNYGKYYYATHYRESIYRRIEFEMFHWFGDPTMQIWTGVPQTLSVSHASTLTEGTNSIDVTVNQPGALICLSKDGVILGRALSTGGVTTVSWLEALSAGDVIHITVTKHNYRPYEGTVTIIPQPTGYVSVSQGVTITPEPAVLGQDFTISFTLKEVLGIAKTFEHVAIAILDASNTFLFDFALYNNVTIPANGTWTQSATNYLYASRPPGTYKAVIRGKVAGGQWFDLDTVDSGVNPKTFQAVSPPLPAPTGVSASDGTYTDSVRITWNSVPGAGYYQVYRNTIDNSSSATVLGTWQSGISYDDYSATPGQTYYYWVKAATDSSGANASDFSSSDSGWRSVATYVLTVSKAGTGTGTVTSIPPGISCGSDCTETYAQDTEVTLIATPDSGSRFDGWSGNGCTGMGNCVVTMDGAKAVTATFTRNTIIISGHVRTENSTGIPGVLLDGLPDSPITDATGYYSASTLTAGWSGLVTPQKTGYTFEPPSRSYSNVTVSLLNEDYTGTSIPPVSYFAAAYSGASEDWLYFIQPTADGGFISVGRTNSFGASNYDIWVVKFDSDGAVTWQKTYGGAGNERAFCIQQTADGGYIVAGQTDSFGAGDADIWVLKLTSNGTITWQRTYGGPAWDTATFIQQTHDGGYIVAGDTNSYGTGGRDIWVLKLSSSGSIIWQKTYGGGNWEGTASIFQTSDSGYIVAGYTGSFGIGWDDILIIKLDYNGNIMWQKTYGGANYDHADSVQQTDDGGYIVAGQTQSFGAGNTDIWILKLSNTGNIIWQKTYGGGNDEGIGILSIQQTSDGSYIVTGHTESFGAGSRDMWIFKLNSSGNILWQKTYGGSVVEWSSAIRQMSDGSYIVGGETFSFGTPGNRDLFVLKLNKDGNIPGCFLGIPSNGLVKNTTVAGVNSSTIPVNTNAIVTATHISPFNTTVSPQYICGP